MYNMYIFLHNMENLMYFKPHKLPIDGLDWKKLAQLIGKANAKLSNYNGILHNMVNPNILLSPLTKQEAVLSSRIEGTRASLSDIYQKEIGEKYDQEKENDIEEINNYRDALNFASTDLQNRPICLNMLKDIHKILLSGVRGHHKNRGVFRTTDVFIGSPGDTIENARYVPPKYEDMMPALNNLEQYIHRDDEEILIQLAVIHAQFEIIHPFNDGNGRMGRILIPLYLYSKEYLRSPVFYLSEFLENNRAEYYDKLNTISSKSDWQSWIEFFLNAVIKQSEVNTQKAKSILALYEKIKELIPDITHSYHSAKICDALFESPFITTTKLLSDVNISNKATANNILKKLVNAGVLKVYREGSGQRPTTYVFADLLNLVEGRNSF